MVVAPLVPFVEYARSVLHEQGNRPDSRYHTRRLDGTGFTYADLKRLVATHDAS